jgi:hypothetical protein
MQQHLPSSLYLDPLSQAEEAADQPFLEMVFLVQEVQVLYITMGEAVVQSVTEEMGFQTLLLDVADMACSAAFTMNHHLLDMEEEEGVHPQAVPVQAPWD